MHSGNFQRAWGLQQEASGQSEKRHTSGSSKLGILNWIKRVEAGLGDSTCWNWINSIETVRMRTIGRSKTIDWKNRQRMNWKCKRVSSAKRKLEWMSESSTS